MATYCEIGGGVVVNRMVWEGHDHPDAGEWVGPVDDLDPEPQIGWAYDGTSFYPPEPEPDPPPADPGYPAWVQPLGAHDAYRAGDRVAHTGASWISTLDANVWEPGVSGWTAL
jgi:hypothetical protein